MIRTLFFTPRALSALSLITARPVIRVRKLSLTCAHQVSQLLSSVSPGWEETNTTQYLLLVTPQTASSRSFKSPQRWDEMSWDEMLDANVPSLSRIGSIRLGLWRRKNRVRRSKAYYGTELLTSVRVTFSSFVTGSKLQPVSPELRVWSRTRLSSPRWRRRRRREETCCVTLWSKSSEWWHRLTKITEKQKQKNNKQNKKNKLSVAAFRLSVTPTRLLQCDSSQVKQASATNTKWQCIKLPCSPKGVYKVVRGLIPSTTPLVHQAQDPHPPPPTHLPTHTPWRSINIEKPCPPWSERRGLPYKESEPKKD